MKSSPPQTGENESLTADETAAALSTLFSPTLEVKMPPGPPLEDDKVRISISSMAAPPMSLASTALHVAQNEVQPCSEIKIKATFSCFTDVSVSSSTKGITGTCDNKRVLQSLSPEAMKSAINMSQCMNPNTPNNLIASNLSNDYESTESINLADKTVENSHLQIDDYSKFPSLPTATVDTGNKEGTLHPNSDYVITGDRLKKRIAKSEEWYDECYNKTLPNRYFNCWKSMCEGWQKYHDVNFKVGINKENVSAHRLILSMFCENPVIKNASMMQKALTISLPELQPSVFRDVVKYFYTGKILLESAPQAFDVLHVANTLCIPRLQKKCTTFLRANINCQNAVKVFCYAIKSQDELLKEDAATFITIHGLDVLKSDGFLQLSQNELYLFLQSQDWFIADEYDVFKNVLRWATHKIKSMGHHPQDVEPSSGSNLRKAIGNAFYEIRFMSLKNVQTFLSKMRKPYDDLFTNEEAINIIANIAAKSSENESENFILDAPSTFNILPRMKKEMPQHFSNPTTGVSTTENMEEQEEGTFGSLLPNNEDATCNVSCLESDLSGNVALAHAIPKVEWSSCHLPPPKKKRKRCKSGAINESVPSPPSTDTDHSENPLKQMVSCQTGEEMYLCAYVKRLRNTEDSHRCKIETIVEAVKISSIPQMRVHLPQLKEFNLNLIPSNYRNFECGTTLKTYIRPKLVFLPNIIFFDKNPTVAETCTKNVLKELLASKVDVTISCSNFVFLKINHENGFLLMNSIKDAQEILNGAQDIPLKILSVSGCELYSLEKMRTDLLEVLVMRRVKGLKNHAGFLQACSNLKTVSWNDFGSEGLNLTENLLNQNPHMEKLSLAKSKLTVTGSLIEHHNFLQELYLDNCELGDDIVTAFPKLFPFVKRIQLYSKKINTPVLYNVLQLEFLEWLFVWEFTYCKVKSNKKRRLTEESVQIQTFLASIFDADFAKKDEKLTFILEKKKELVTASPGTSSSAIQQQKSKDPFDASYWKGTNFKTMKQKFNAITELDFKNFSYDRFFSTYEHFKFFESTEADLKKKKPKQVSNNVNANNDDEQNASVDEIMEPVSNSSSTGTDEVVDIMNIC